MNISLRISVIPTERKALKPFETKNFSPLRTSNKKSDRRLRRTTGGESVGECYTYESCAKEWIQSVHIRDSRVSALGLHSYQLYNKLVPIDTNACFTWSVRNRFQRFVSLSSPLRDHCRRSLSDWTLR